MGDASTDDQAKAQSSEEYTLPKWFLNKNVLTKTELDKCDPELVFIDSDTAKKAGGKEKGTDQKQRKRRAQYEVLKDEYSGLRLTATSDLVPNNPENTILAQPSILLRTHQQSTFVGSVDYNRRIVMQLAKDVGANLITCDMEDLQELALEFDDQRNKAHASSKKEKKEGETEQAEQKEQAESKESTDDKSGSKTESSESMDDKADTKEENSVANDNQSDGKAGKSEVGDDNTASKDSSDSKDNESGTVNDSADSKGDPEATKKTEAGKFRGEQQESEKESAKKDAIESEGSEKEAKNEEAKHSAEDHTQHTLGFSKLDRVYLDDADCSESSGNSSEPQHHQSDGTTSEPVKDSNAQDGSDKTLRQAEQDLARESAPKQEKTPAHTASSSLSNDESLSVTNATSDDLSSRRSSGNFSSDDNDDSKSNLSSDASSDAGTGVTTPDVSDDHVEPVTMEQLQAGLSATHKSSNEDAVAPVEAKSESSDSNEKQAEERTALEKPANERTAEEALMESKSSEDEPAEGKVVPRIEGSMWYEPLGAKKLALESQKTKQDWLKIQQDLSTRLSEAKFMQQRTESSDEDAVASSSSGSSPSISIAAESEADRLSDYERYCMGLTSPACRDGGAKNPEDATAVKSGGEEATSDTNTSGENKDEKKEEEDKSKAKDPDASRVKGFTRANKTKAMEASTCCDEQNEWRKRDNDSYFYTRALRYFAIKRTQKNEAHDNKLNMRATRTLLNAVQQKLAQTPDLATNDEKKASDDDSKTADSSKEKSKTDQTDKTVQASDSRQSPTEASAEKTDDSAGTDTSSESSKQQDTSKADTEEPQQARQEAATDSKTPEPCNGGESADAAKERKEDEQKDPVTPRKQTAVQREASPEGGSSPSRGGRVSSLISKFEEASSPKSENQAGKEKEVNTESTIDVSAQSSGKDDAAPTSESVVGSTETSTASTEQEDEKARLDKSADSKAMIKDTDPEAATVEDNKDSENTTVTSLTTSTSSNSAESQNDNTESSGTAKTEDKASEPTKKEEKTPESTYDSTRPYELTIFHLSNLKMIRGSPTGVRNLHKMLARLSDHVQALRKAGKFILLVISEAWESCKRCEDSGKGYCDGWVRAKMYTNEYHSFHFVPPNITEHPKLYEANDIKYYNYINGYRMKRLLRTSIPHAFKSKLIDIDPPKYVDDLWESSIFKGRQQWDYDALNRARTQIQGLTKTTKSLVVADVVGIMNRIMRQRVEDDEDQWRDGKGEEKDADAELKAKVEALRPQCDEYEKELLDTVVYPGKMRTRFEDVIIDQETKDWLRQIISLSKLRADSASDALRAYIRVSGALLYGPPGTGKTLLCRAIAQEAGMNMISLDASSIQNCYIGETEKNIAAAFSLATKLSPCILFLDEVDSLFYRRSGSDRSWQRSALNQFLANMDGLTKGDDQPFVMAATNRPSDLDEAFLRRLPHRVLFTLPETEDRKKIFRTYVKEADMDPDVKLDVLAAKTEGYSGSDISSLCGQAAMAWVMEQAEALKPGGEAVQVKLQQKHFEKALAKTKPTVSEWSNGDLREFAKRFNPGDLKKMKDGHAELPSMYT